MATPLQNRNKILALAEQRIKLLYTDAYTRAMKIAEVRNALNAAENVNFNFRAFPRAEKELNKIMGELSISIEKMTESGLNAAHKDGLSVATQRILAITASAAAKDMAAEAANANRLSQAMGTKLANEKRGGLTLSERIWKTVQTSRNELEIIIQNNLIEGKGADVASREVRQYLNDPKKLFRRVKDKETGEYHLSKAAQQYHPGQGKYRSSYMNARRLVVSEMNMATQASECAAYADNPLIAGYEIRLSNNHTVKDPRHPGKVLDLHDICDELQGNYPPTFKFTGWHPHCYTENAMVMTARGWVKFADLRDDDMCLSLGAYHTTEYAPIIDRQRYEFHGDMVRFSNRSFECVVTPDHEVLYLNKCDGRFKRMSAAEFTYNNGGIYRSSENYRYDIGSIFINGKEIAFDDFCEFMGYWLSDGYVAVNRESQIGISQQPDQKPYNAIIDVIKRMGYEPKIGEQAIYIFDKDLHDYLRQFGKCNEKFVPEAIRNASKRQIDIFLNAFVQCDGHKRKPKAFVGSHGHKCVPKQGEESYYTTSERMMADLCICLLNAEYRPSVRKNKPTTAVKKDGSIVKGNYDCYVVSKCLSSSATYFKKESVRYDGFVYDVTIDNGSHAIYIMENGKCYWGSNCRCTMIPILISPDERRKLAQARAEGKTYHPKGVITDVPDNFKKWVAKNQDRIASAKTLPFFLQDNGELTDEGYKLDEKFGAAETTPEPTQEPKEEQAKELVVDDWENSTLKPIIEALEKNSNIAQNEVQKFGALPTEEEIIQNVGGGDLTRGSCSSLAYTYLGNKGGLNVLDFRDGESRVFFARNLNIRMIADAVGGTVTHNTNDFIAAAEALKTAEQGKEYYFACGSHAAVVRKTDKSLEYLELQSSKQNGWKALDKWVLKWRFGAKRSHSTYGHKYEVNTVLVDSELLYKNGGFKRMLEFINTAEGAQRKGALGTIK